MRGRTLVALAFALILTGCGKSTDSPSSSASTPIKQEAFKLEPGLEHDVCGIGVVVKFIPATATSSKTDFAVVYGGPVSKVEDKVQNHTGDEVLPDNAAHAVAGTTITVYGKQFRVEAVDTSGSSVRLRPLC